MKKDEPNQRKILAISCRLAALLRERSVSLPAASRAASRIEIADYWQRSELATLS